MQIQLPNDAVATGYKKIAPYKYEQVFYSESLNFEGTELEFVAAGHAYRYVEVSSFVRRVV